MRRSRHLVGIAAVLAALTCGREQVRPPIEYTGDRRGDDAGTVGDATVGDPGAGDPFVLECTIASDCITPGFCELAIAQCLGQMCRYSPSPDSEPCEDHNPCTTDDHCDGAGGCTGNPVPCNSPGAPQCVDNNSVYRTYETVGTCDPQDGSCDYDHTDTACPDCANHCMGLCDDFPCPDTAAGCMTNGTCVVSPPPELQTSCAYSPAADGTACSDAGSPGVCLSGACVECFADAHCPGLCEGCNTTTRTCGTTVTDDNRCGIIDCPSDTACRDWSADITTNRCARIGVCKTSADCTVVADAANGTACGDPTATGCEAPDSCDGAGTCIDRIDSDGTACDDGDPCNGTDTCSGGSCTDHSGDPCAGRPGDGDSDCSETCNPSTGACNLNDPPLSACNDGDPCNGTDTCNNSGVCANHSGDPCAGRPGDADADCSETCNPSTGACNANDPPLSSCNDGDLCNGTDTCDSSGACANHSGDPCAGRPGDGDADCSESCNSSTGECNANDPPLSSCNDGDLCNGSDTCNASGVCANHTGDPCATSVGDGDSDCSEACNASNGQCTSNDPTGSLCSNGGRCDTGSCIGCSSSNECTVRDFGGSDYLCLPEDSETLTYSWDATVGEGGTYLNRKTWCRDDRVQAGTCVPQPVNFIPGPTGMNGGYACCNGLYACTSDGPANRCQARGISPSADDWLCSDNVWYECGPDALEETIQHGSADFLCAGADTWHGCTSANPATFVLAGGHHWICTDDAYWDVCIGTTGLTITAGGTEYTCCFNHWDIGPCL